jgi:uncharacterized protein (DUF362 family)
MNRRQFVKSVSLAATAFTVSPLQALRARPLRQSAANYFSVHPFIEAHPEAVFIKRTNISAKTDSAAKKAAGNELGKQLFTLSETSGIPLTNKIAVKPNLTCTFGIGNTDDGMGIITDRYFSEGFLGGMIESGFTADNIYIREGNMLGDGYNAETADYLLTGYGELATNLGVHYDDFPTRKVYDALSDTLQEGTEVIYKATPDGFVFKRIGYVAPFNADDSWLLNISKFKTHSMGMTLCAKNLQGTCICPYIQFCNKISTINAYPSTILQDFQPDFAETVTQLHTQHVKDGIVRWDRPGDDFTGGFGQELWAQRTCDSLSVTKPGLSIIEGIYGRNGNGFEKGPGPNGEAQDFMSNMIIFGKNHFLVDIIGTWLAGHEPGNFGFSHIAQERGFIDNVNPMAIPVYLWDSTAPTLTPLSDFTRTPLVTNYLRRDYNGQTEEEYHLVNEAYQYSSARPGAIAQRPSVRMLGTHGGLNRSLQVIEYTVNRNSHVCLELLDMHGSRVRVLRNAYSHAGTHMATLDTSRQASGQYILRMISNGYCCAQPIWICR